MNGSNDSQQNPRKAVPKRISVRTEKKEAKGNNIQRKRSQTVTGGFRYKATPSANQNAGSERRQFIIDPLQTPSKKKKADVFTNVTTNVYQGQQNAGFSKQCKIFKVCSVESSKYVQEFHTPVCYCGCNAW